MPSYTHRASNCITQASLAVLALSAAEAQTAARQPYGDPYTSGPTRPFDGSPRTNYATPTRPESVKAPAIWQGVYLGAHFGHRWSEATPDGWGVPAAHATGTQFGGHLGANTQSGPLVFGVEADLTGGGPSANSAAGNTTLMMRDSWTSSVRARAGVAVGNMLIYGTGGLAISDQDITATVGSLSAHITQTRTGAVFGAGLEYKFAPQVSARIEALHTSYKSTTIPWATGAPVIKQDSTALRGGLTFHFN